MFNIKRCNILFFLCIIAFALLFYGCSGSDQQQQPKQQAGEENQKKPDKLKEIEGNVEAMIGMLSGVPNEPAKNQQQGGQQDGQQDGQQQGGGQQGSQQQGGGQQQGTQPEQKALLEPKPDVNWEQALKDVEKIHTQWNDYVSQAAKDGVPKNNIDGFSNTLNDLTNQIGSKNRTGALLAANNLNLHLSNFWTIYDSKVPPDLKRLKHYLRNTIYYSDLLEWNKVEESMNIAKNLFQTIRATASKEKQDPINKIDFSIQELEKVVKQKNPPLIKLKGKLALDNLMEMEKDMESSR